MERPCRSASCIASADFPAAVGPQMMRSSAPSESTLEFIPANLDDRAAPVHVVRGQGRTGERHIQRAHFGRSEYVAGFHRRFARDSRGEALVFREAAAEAVARKRGECVAKA